MRRLQSFWSACRRYCLSGMRCIRRGRQPVVTVPHPDAPFDVHAATIDNSEDFHRWMDALDRIEDQTIPWRERMTFTQQRMHAKRFNFFRLYGGRSEEYIESLRKNAEKK